MNAPYREPGSAPSEDGPSINHDYIADVRRARDPRGTVKALAIVVCMTAAMFGLLVLILGGSISNWLTMVGFVLAFYGLVLFPIALIALRRADERMNVADLLDDTDERRRK